MKALAAAILAALSVTAFAQEAAEPAAAPVPTPVPAAVPAPMPKPVKVPTKESPMLGTWNWTSTKEQCTETHQYLPNGTKITNSGEDVSEDYVTVFRLTDTLYKVSGLVSKDNGKPDCAGTTTAVGANSAVYIRFKSENSILTCSNMDESSCYGTATRAADASK